MVEWQDNEEGGRECLDNAAQAVQSDKIQRCHKFDVCNLRQYLFSLPTEQKIVIEENIFDDNVLSANRWKKKLKRGKSIVTLNYIYVFK